jgi:hypothetical protein
MDLHDRVREFIQQTLNAMGLSLEISIRDLPDSIRIELAGEGGEQLLRRRAEALDALQHIVNTAFRRQLKDERTFVVDCLDYRKAKDTELRQMARPPAGSHHRGRRPSNELGKHRRRFPEDRHHLGATLKTPMLQRELSVVFFRSSDARGAPRRTKTPASLFLRR